MSFRITFFVLYLFSVSGLSGQNINISGQVFWLCLADLADLAHGNGFFLADTDLAALLDLALYLKELLILG